jgi:GT2 family glycosyltransferase
VKKLAKFMRTAVDPDKIPSMYENVGLFYDSPASEMNYVIGASMFVDKAFIADVGLMCADYFLYFEEIDWAERGRQRGWEIGYCWKSKIYHKEGESTHCGYKSKEKKAFFVFFNRIKRGQFGLVKGAIRAMLNININSWHKLN